NHSRRGHVNGMLASMIAQITESPWFSTSGAILAWGAAQPCNEHPPPRANCLYLTMLIEASNRMKLLVRTMPAFATRYQGLKCSCRAGRGGPQCVVFIPQALLVPRAIHLLPQRFSA